MDRFEQWPSILRKGIGAHINEPFVWGQSDCTFVFDVIRDMTGYDAIAEIRGYSTEAGALKSMLKAGFQSAIDLICERFEEVDPALAIRGDIGYPASVAHPLMCPAIIDGANAFSKAIGGAIIVPRSAIARAWRV